MDLQSHDVCVPSTGLNLNSQLIAAERMRREKRGPASAVPTIRSAVRTGSTRPLGRPPGAAGDTGESAAASTNPRKQESTMYANIIKAIFTFVVAFGLSACQSTLDVLDRNGDRSSAWRQAPVSGHWTQPPTARAVDPVMAAVRDSITLQSLNGVATANVGQERVSFSTGVEICQTLELESENVYYAPGQYNILRRPHNVRLEDSPEQFMRVVTRVQAEIYRAWSAADAAGRRPLVDAEFYGGADGLPWRRGAEAHYDGSLGHTFTIAKEDVLINGQRPQSDITVRAGQRIGAMWALALLRAYSLWRVFDETNNDQFEIRRVTFNAVTSTAINPDLRTSKVKFIFSCAPVAGRTS